jgi:hypothetical protein
VAVLFFHVLKQVELGREVALLGRVQDGGQLGSVRPRVGWLCSSRCRWPSWRSAVCSRWPGRWAGRQRPESCFLPWRHLALCFCIG